MIGRQLSAVRGIGSTTEFEDFLSNLWVDETGGQTPTIGEERKQYRFMVSERFAYIDRF